MTTSYARGPRAVPLLGETIGENLRRTVERFGDREALVVRHQSFRATYRELWEQVDRAARGLLARGVKTGDRVGVGRRTASSGSCSSTPPPASARSSSTSTPRTRRPNSNTR